jgi:hypothetical protein
MEPTEKAVSEFKSTASEEQHVVDVKLIIKAPGKQEAENLAFLHLNNWLQINGPETLVPGEGYPYGTLLWFKIQGDDETHWGHMKPEPVDA